jgi:hypothetical protein
MTGQWNPTQIRLEQLVQIFPVNGVNGTIAFVRPAHRQLALY